MDGSKLKTQHLVRGVDVCKDKNYAFYDFVLMEDLEYAALLAWAFHHQAFWSRKKEREEFKAGESLLRIRYPAKKLEDQATQTRKGGHRCYDIQHQGRNPKADNYRVAAHFY